MENHVESLSAPNDFVPSTPDHCPSGPATTFQSTGHDSSLLSSTNKHLTAALRKGAGPLISPRQPFEFV